MGCGSIKATTDAGLDPTDATDVDAPPAKGPVTVTFFYTDPVPDANVIIYDPTGAVFAEGTTGLDGSKRFEDVPRGSTLTVGKSLGNAPRVYTVVGVEPNDNLVLGVRSEPFTSGSINVTASNILADYLRVGAGCDIAFWDGGLKSVGAHTTCAVTPLTWNIVAIAFNGAGEALSYSVLTNVSKGTSVTLSSWRTDWATFAVNWSNPPAGTSNTRVGLRFRYPLPDPAPAGSLGSSGTTTFRYPKDATNGLEYFVEATGSGTYSSLSRRIAPTASVTLDLGEELLPFVTSFAADLNDRARPNFFWTAPSDVTKADLLKLQAIWDGPGYYEWHIYARPDLPSPFQLPAIPASWGAIMTPPTVSGWTFSASVALSDDESKADWNAVRVQPASYVQNRLTIASTNATF